MRDRAKCRSLQHLIKEHYQRAEEVRLLRQQTLDAAYAAYPERFVRKPPQPPALPTQVWINPPPKPESGPPDSDKKTQ